MRPGRQLALLGAIFVILASAVWFGGKGGWENRLAPNLGLDLVGGSRVTLQAQTGADGQPPTAQDLEQARRIIAERVDARGVAEAQVVIEGDQNIVISVAKKGNDAINDVGQASQLFFRKVLKQTDGSGLAAAPQPTASPSAPASPKPSTAASPKAAAASPKPSTSASTGGTGGGAAMAPTPTPSPAASKSAAASPAASPKAAAPKPSAAPANPKVTAAQVQAKIGKAAWDAAGKLTAVPTDPAQIAALEPFAALNAYEVALLSPQMQYNVPQVTCEQLDDRPPGSINNPDAEAVACENGMKYLLDKSEVKGTDVDKASPQIEQNTNRRVVSLDFSSDGLDKWTKLTKESFNNEGQKCDTTALGPQSHCRVAVVLDNKIISSPEIQGVLGDDSVISGDFDAKSANDLANNLNYGSLSMTFVQQEAQSITPTLGGEHLKAGLLAAGIGMLLVVIYSFFYYRLLGTVIVLSLILSAALTFLALVFLGREMGFTLTLAGIAGFIVSLGVAADSFVIYFERLKDEIREGRSPRSAVPRAWVRARRTILTANAISLMAALVLYLVSSGAVAGFAFALGLATLLDLIVVFLFRHPIMAMFARTDAFLSPRVSGLGRVLHEAKEAK
ncbi:protein translocase subunit SecD [Catellatospora vulcania]|uniref:protein translocase subunit SecD n=1 Tax=Catellatospora vulcania TaxID=1460450 RepID=UPI0012D3A042|nr:protein translocase subunit SecD [Catellatospora vulcania]